MIKSKVLGARTEVRGPVCTKSFSLKQILTVTTEFKIILVTEVLSKIQSSFLYKII